MGCNFPGISTKSLKFRLNILVIHLHTYPPTYLSTCLSVYLSIYLSVSLCLPLRPSVRLCMYTSICLFIHPFTHLPTYQPTYLPTYLSVALQSFVGPWPLCSFLIFYTDDRTPWTEDQSVARPLPTHRATQTQNKRT
jgi:hypothetical protein